MNEEILYEEHPSMFRNHPVAFVLTSLLCLVGVGFIIFFFWWLDSIGTKLTVTNERVTLRKGVLSKSLVEVWHRDVRNVQLHQSFGQRVFGVGKLGISSAGQGGVEIEVAGIPDPEGVKSLIDQHRRERDC
ncbi:MAG: PH domain-containing protein [Planctomycetota bacterium]